MRTTEHHGVKAALVAYCEVLDGCEIEDLRAAVASIFQANTKWAPSAPEFGQVVRNAAACRSHVPKGLEPPSDVEESYPTEEECARMSEKWQNIQHSFSVSESPAEWRRSRIAEGKIKKSADAEKNPGILPDGVRL